MNDITGNSGVYECVRSSVEWHIRSFSLDEMKRMKHGMNSFLFFGSFLVEIVDC